MEGNKCYDNMCGLSAEQVTKQLDTLLKSPVSGSRCVYVGSQ